uniref:Transposase n=1 Tax=Panagrellus redivivus TaxID=6233 RepID=A0A7E4USK1_PANRE
MSGFDLAINKAKRQLVRQLFETFAKRMSCMQVLKRVSDTQETLKIDFGQKMGKCRGRLLAFKTNIVPIL